MKLLYLFSGTRKGKMDGAPSIDFPDTQLYGLNHMGKFGIDAGTIEWTDIVKSSWLQKIIGFRLRHFLLFFASRKYDVVFGSSLLYMMILKKFFRTNTKYVLFNLGINRTIASHQKHPIRLQVISSLLAEFSAIVCLSENQKKYIEEKMPFLVGKVFSVHLGVDTVYYEPVLNGRNQTILSVGRDNGRDYKTVIAAAKLLPDRQFEIVCSRRNLVDIGPLPDNVNVIYDLPLAGLREKYRTAGLLLLVTHPDNWLDGSDCSGQTVLLDAMANGIPVIATRKAYLNEYVRDRIDVTVVDCYSPQELVEAIKELDNSQISLGLAENARKRAEMEYPTKQMAKKLSEIFYQVIS
jgi:glycosyltransferase involved in cell wall biosynthesis